MDATAEVYIQDEVQCVHLCKLQAVKASTSEMLIVRQGPYASHEFHLFGQDSHD
jgi:hypothetical protein